MLGLLFAFSSPIDQSSIRGDRRLLWRKLWEFSCPGQFVSSVHNQANLLMNNTTRAEQVFILSKGGSVKALDVLLPWQFKCFSTSLTACMCLPQPLYSGSKWEEWSPRWVRNSQVWALSGCVDITNQVLQLSPSILHLFGHQSAHKQLLAASRFISCLVKWKAILPQPLEGGENSCCKDCWSSRGVLFGLQKETSARDSFFHHMPCNISQLMDCLTHLQYQWSNF